MGTSAQTLTPADCRAARARLGLTQAELARRAGLSRATLVNFEKGRGEPLHRSRLAHMLRTLQKARTDLEAKGVLHLAVFGSVARMEDGPESDLDIVVEIDPETRFDIFDLAGIAGDISRLLGMKVDVLERKSLKPAFLRDVEKDQIYVF